MSAQESRQLFLSPGLRLLPEAFPFLRASATGTPSHGDVPRAVVGQLVAPLLGGPWLAPGRQISACTSWKRGRSPSGQACVRGGEQHLGAGGSRGSPTSSFQQRQVLPRLLIRNHVPVTRGLSCVSKGWGSKFG